jgi:hypothetical protein
MLHTLDPPFSTSFSEGRPFSTPDPDQENNQATPDKSQEPRANLAVIGFAQHEPEARQGKSN